MNRTLVVRSDSAGDVLLSGPAVRAVAAASDRVTMLAGPRGSDAARMLPGVHEVIEWRCPWIDPEPQPIGPDDVSELVGLLTDRRIDRALVLTSFHQSPLPMALALRLAEVQWVGAISTDYAGSLLDLRHHVDEMLPEAERALSLASAAGYSLPDGDEGALRVRTPLPNVEHLLPSGPFVVLHPGTSVPARAWPAERFARTVRLLSVSGRRVVVTGAPSERDLTAGVAGREAVDLGGLTTLRELAGVLQAAEVVVVANTGPAHLAAAVGTPVVSLFAPTVPPERWAPYRVPTVLLGDLDAACRDTRVTQCPFEGHPCLSAVTPEQVLEGVNQLSSRQPATVFANVALERS